MPLLRSTTGEGGLRGPVLASFSLLKGHLPRQARGPGHVRFTPKADILRCGLDVR